jgi:hypothetical protein
MREIPGRAFIEPPQNPRADILPDADKSMGSTPGVKTPFPPDGPDVLDGGDVEEGFGVGGLATGRRVWRVYTKSLIL